MIGFSNELAMRSQVEHLLGRGRSRIAFVGNNNERDEYLYGSSEH